MARINLLPWREELREAKKRQVFIALAIAVALAITLIFLAGQLLDNLMQSQMDRNQLIQTRITALEAKSKEISELQTQRQQLIERIKIIQGLQGERTSVAHIFSELATTLPDGVYYMDVAMKGNGIDLKGKAESNQLISKLMTNIEKSSWLGKPELTSVTAAVESENTSAIKMNDFTITIKRNDENTDAMTKPQLVGKSKP